MDETLHHPVVHSHPVSAGFPSQTWAYGHWVYMGLYGHVYGHWATFNSNFGVLLLLALWPDLSSYIANDN